MFRVNKYLYAKVKKISKNKNLPALRKADEGDVVEFKSKKKTKQPTTPTIKQLSPDQLKLAQTNFTSESYNKDIIPFFNPKKISAIKRGDLLPKDVENNIKLVPSPEGIEYVYEPDPGFWNATKELLKPLDFEMTENRNALLKENTNFKVYFKNRDFDIKNFNHLILCMVAQKKPVFHLLDLIKNTYKLKPNEKTYVNLMSGSNHKEALILFKKMMDDKIIPKEAAYGTLIKSYAHDGLIDESYQLLEIMKSHNLVPNQVHHCTILTACIKSGDYTRAWEHYERMVSIDGIIPDPVTYQIMINCCAEERKVEKAISIMNDMELHQINPIREVYNALLKAYSKRKDYRSKIFEIVEKMQVNGYDLDFYGYHSVIYAMALEGNIEKVKELVQKMVNQDIKPKIETFSLVIFSLSNYMVKNRYKSTEIIQNAEEIFLEILKRKLKVGVRDLNILLRVYTHSLKYKTSEIILRERFTQLGLKPDAISYTHLIVMYSTMKRPESAMKLIREMESLDLKPTYTSYKSIAMTYIKMGQHDQSFKVLEEMHYKYKYMLAPHDLVAHKKIQKASMPTARRLNSLKIQAERIAENL